MNHPAGVPAEQLESLVARLADEFMERGARGEHPSVEEYVGRHPEHAPVIREVLACVRMVRASSAGAGSMAGPGEPEALGDLGDFRLLREIGRGGMGVVYEAEQVSLGRRVALKVLPFAAALDARHLQRFKNEAHAAAQLHHTNIVPVYAVGCERNVHFYAMQFIDGRSLADLIRELRGQTQPGAPGRDGSALSPPGGPAADTAAPAIGALSTERSARVRPTSGAWRASGSRRPKPWSTPTGTA